MNITPLGIDIAKKKFDAVLLFNARTFHKEFSNNEQGFEKLLLWLEQKGVSNVHVCMEATGIYSEDLAYFLYHKRFQISVVNPMRIRAFAKSEMKRNKTDKADAETIARVCKIHLPSLWIPPLPESKQLRTLYRCLKTLQEEKVRFSLRLQKIKEKESTQYRLWQNLIWAIDKEIISVHQDIDLLISSYQHLKDKMKRLMSIPGISKITSLAILSEVPDITNFSSARQLAAYAGLSPQHKVSGTSVKGQTRLSKIGNPILRKALYMPAIVAKNHNPYLKEFAQRLLKKSKHPMAVIAAVMRKLLHIAYGVLKSEKNFELSCCGQLKT